jgi:hypothetical protein
MLEPTTGLEPVTSSLPRKCSTTELCGQERAGAILPDPIIAKLFPAKTSVQRPDILERVMGVEPTSSAWKAEVLPLNYTRLPRLSPAYLVEGVGFEPTKA